MATYVGGVSNLICNITDQNGNPVDPGVVTANIQTPDGSVTPLTVTRQSQGVYVVYNYQWTQAQENIVQFQCTTTPYPFNNYQSFAVSPDPF